MCYTYSKQDNYLVQVIGYTDTKCRNHQTQETGRMGSLITRLKAILYWLRWTREKGCFQKMSMPV